MTVAELTKNKGITYAIAAIAELRKEHGNIEYLIIGDGELRKQLEREVQEYNVGDSVHFLGFIENASIYLKAFDQLLIPSIKEGMPMCSLRRWPRIFK